MLKSTRRAGLQAGVLGITDQVLLSSTNLAVGLTLAREMPPASFGIYVIVFALSLICASVQVALITDPLVVLGSPREGPSRAAYLAAAWRLQLGLSIGLTLIAAAAAGAARGVAGAGSELPAALAGLALSVVPLQAQTFIRALFFVRLQPGLVLLNDMLLTALRLGLLAWLAISGNLSTFSVMATAALAAAVAVIAGLVSCRELRASAPSSFATMWEEHWRYGRWLLATSAAYWGSGQAPALISSAMIDPVAAAILKACQYLVAPLNVAFTGLDGVLAPRAARLRVTRGADACRRYLMAVGAACGTAVVLYSAGLLPVIGPLMSWLYRGQYTGYSAIVALFLLDALFTAVSRAPMLSLKVAGRTQTIFFTYLAGAAAGVSALVLLVPTYGVLGAALAAPASSGVVLAGLLAVSMAPANEQLASPAVRAVEP